MKRIGNLFDKICSETNIQLAYSKAKLGKSKRYSVLHFEKNLDENLLQIQKELIYGTYTTSDYSIFTIKDPKERIVYRLPFKDRVVHHAIMNVLENIWTSVFVSNTYSCIKDRGIHGALRHLKRDLRNVNDTKYCLKLDIKKFYPSIDHDVLKIIIRRKIKDIKLLNLIDGIVESAPGVPIGNYLSQFLANLYLSYFDHWIKEVKAVKYYYRYADDIVILSADKTHLHELLGEISIYFEQRLKVRVKDNYQVFPVDVRGIDFVGYIFFHTHILMRKGIKKRMCRKAFKLSKNTLSENKYNQLMASHFGWAKHCNSNNLLKKLSCMNKFSDFGIKADNNKNIFAVPVISIEEVTNCEIEVLDFESGVKTKHGPDRCIVKIRYEGIERKLFTNAMPIKEALNKITKSGFPFATTIKQQRFGSGSGKTFYFT